jgi:hypothetical protein
MLLVNWVKSEIRTNFEVKRTKSARIVEINHSEPGETAPHLVSFANTR